MTGSWDAGARVLPGPFTTGNLRTGSVSGTVPAVDTQPSVTVASTTDPDTTAPLVENQTNTYQTGFDPLSIAQLSTINALTNAFGDASLSDTDQRVLNGLAQSLGFRDLGMMQNQLRALSASQRQELISQLRQRLSGSSDDTAVLKDCFQKALKDAITGLFQNQTPPLPVPNFASEPASPDLWDSASLAAALNAFNEIKTKDPERFSSVARGGAIQSNGQPGPLQMIRRSTPEVGNRDRMLETLFDSVQIAHADSANGRIYLYDPAVRGDQSMISGQIVGKLDLITRLDRTKTGGLSTELKPVYTSEELNARDLNIHEGETQGKNGSYAQRLRGMITGELMQRYGGNDWTRLQDSLNFILRYRGRFADQVKGEIQPNDPRIAAALNKLDPDMLKMVICRMEQMDTVSQVQSFLRNNMPGAEKIAVDGMLGPRTQKMVQAFQTSIALNTLKERIEDDPNLPEARKRALLGELNDLFKQLADNSEKAGDILRSASTTIRDLLNEDPSELAEHTRNFLTNDLGKLDDLVSGQFNPTTAEYLVNNWLNVMDSGQGNDLAEQLMVHEMGHIWERQLDNNGRLQVYDNWVKLFGNIAKEHLEEGPNHNHTAEEAHEATSRMTMHDFEDAFGDDLSASSDYGSANPREDFAEATRVFTYDPDRLMRRSPMKFLFMNALHNNRFSADQIIEMARRCGLNEDALKARLDSFLGQGDQRIQFGFPMAEQLRLTYQDLSDKLNALTSPSVMRFSQNDEETNVAPGTQISSTQQQPDPNKSGWLFDKLVDRYKELNQQLQQPNLQPEERSRIQGQMQALIEDFMNHCQGGQLGDVSAGSAAFRDALIGLGYSDQNTAPNAGELQKNNYTSGNVTQEGLAIVAALAIYRATGSFNREEHPELADHLPDSFDRLLADPLIQSAMAPNTPYSSTFLLEGAIGQLNRLDAQQNDINKKFKELSDLSGLKNIANALDGVWSSLKTLLGPILPEQPPTSLLSPEDQVRLNDALRGQARSINTARSKINELIGMINRLAGTSYTPMSQSEAQDFFGNLYSQGYVPIDQDNLLSYLQQRQSDAATTG